MLRHHPAVSARRTVWTDGADATRAAVSIPANVAEGACRRKTNVYLNHVSIALGSHGELETCIEIAFRLRYLSPEGKRTLLDICDSTGRFLNGLSRSLEAKAQNE